MSRDIHHKSAYSLGVDFARMGEDSSAFVVVEESIHDGELYVVFITETKHKLLTDAINKVVYLDSQFHFNKIYLDETGMGSGPTDVLKEKVGHRIEGVTFTTKTKQDMYQNLRRLLETKTKGKKGGLHLPNHKKLLYQLMDLRYEIGNAGDIKIHHSDRGHDDFPDALALACLYWRSNNKPISAGGSFAIG